MTYNRMIICSAAQKLFEKLGQKMRFRHFLENLEQKLRFFSARSPSKFSFIVPKTSLESF